MKIYDYSFLKTLKIPSSFLSLASIIYALRNEEENKKKDFPAIFTNLEKVAIIQSIKGSNAIEGYITSDKRIEEIVNQNSNPLNHSEKEIAGYKDALNIIHNNYKDIDVSIESILNIHAILSRYSEGQDKGVFKQRENVIREIRTDDTSSIRWNPVSKKDTPKAMESLILAYIDACNDDSINSLLLIPCFILDFLCIHPFSDGNGRMSRLLSLLLLYHQGFDISKYISFEEQINNYKGSYYEALRLSSIGWHDNNNDYIPFIENFLFTLYRCYKELDKRFLTVKSGKSTKTKRIEDTVLSAFLPISKKEIISLLPDISVTTIEKVLSTMLKEGKIQKIGNTSNARYLKIK